MRIIIFLNFLTVLIDCRRLDRNVNLGQNDITLYQLIGRSVTVTSELHSISWSFNHENNTITTSLNLSLLVTPVEKDPHRVEVTLGTEAINGTIFFEQPNTQIRESPKVTLVVGGKHISEK